MTVRTRMLAILGVAVAVVACSAVPALAEVECASCRPWWNTTVGSIPAAIQPGSAKSEVQELTTSPEAVVTLTVDEGNVTVGTFATEPYFKEYKEIFGFEVYPELNAANVQSASEGVYGAGNVEVVARGPGGAPPLEVRSIRGGADRLVPELEAKAGAGSADVKVPVYGQPDGEVVVTAANLGDATLDARTAPVAIASTLPPGLTAVSIKGLAGRDSDIPRGPVDCDLASLSCSFKEGTLPPYYPIEVVIGVNVTGPVSGPVQARVSGGEALGGGEVAAGSASRVVRVGDEPAGFGVEDYELTPEEMGGVPDTRAGSHPFQLTTTFVLNRALRHSEGNIGLTGQSVALPKDVRFKWPAGLVGNPSPLPRCTLAQFLTLSEKGGSNDCPQQSAVGVARVLLDYTHASAGEENLFVPVFNLEPSRGEPARFAFIVGFGTPVYIDPSVRSGEDYGITVNTDNISQELALLKAQVTIWGVPGRPEHDISRGWGCMETTAGAENPPPCHPSEEAHPPAFLSMPTSCTGPLSSVVEADSWEAPAAVDTLASSPMPALDGCGRLPFEPSIRVKPDSSAASSPSGLTVDVHVPEEGSVSANGLAESDPRGITVALPEGVAVNPSGGDGLTGCSEGLVGYEGPRAFPTAPGSELPAFKPYLPGSIVASSAGDAEALQPGVNFCADSSKIGTVKIKTPILPEPLEGSIYLATQNENPFGSLLAIYLVAEDEAAGVLVKLAGQVHLGPTGQLVTTFENSPQAPFEDAELHFFGGERAPLATPARCGAYTTTASFKPWSAEPGEAEATAQSTFDITSGPNGSACPGASLPFSPFLTGGSTNINAGSFTPLSTTIGREDGQQNMQSVTLHFPAGLSGLLSSVKLCGEQQANEGTCGPESQIGETTVAAGVGSDPVSVTGGKVYITEKYHGAPFGLSIVNPVKAGPFDLERDTANPSQDPACDCVVVRATIEVDPHTAALTITTDPSGPHAIPHLIDGIPVQIKKVNVLINRPGFTFNPTNCSAMKIEGSIASDENASSPVAVPFQATNCAALKFQPKFAVSTGGKTSKAKGASLSVKLTYPKTAQGVEANIARVKVDLPKQLPSRLTTLQKACTAAQFNANPAGCPAASVIGHAKAVTPLLPVPLEGPAYFVSHGGEAFPSLIIVLQGAAPYNVTLDLVGTTFISKAGITSSTFKTVPDAPVGSFELNLPEGKYSALAANGNLCTSKLAMPTEFLGQNGAKINESTPIGVTGCSTAISIVSHKIKGRTLTVSVSVPAAGKVTASGKGLSASSKSAKGRETLTFKLTQKQGGKLSTKLKIAFKPSKGGKQAKSLSVKFKK